METSYKCPICNKSVTNMEFQFRNIDMSIESQPMPPEFEDTRAVILCNDCSAKTSVKYHWLGLKCAVCLSYNTAQLQILGANPEAGQASGPQPVAQLPEASAATTTAHVTFPQEIPTGREIPRRRRHSSNVVVPLHNTAGESDPGLQAADRLSRSFSPMPNLGGVWNDAQMGAIEEEEREDILGFWSRFQRSIASDEDEGDKDEAADSEDDSDWSTEEEEDAEDDDEDEEDFKDFSLLGRKSSPAFTLSPLARVPSVLCQPPPLWTYAHMTCWLTNTVHHRSLVFASATLGQDSGGKKTHFGIGMDNRGVWAEVVRQSFWFLGCKACEVGHGHITSGGHAAYKLSFFFF